MNAPTTIGKYQIQGMLGQGGMGTVYKGFDPAIHREVAVKTVTKSALDPADLQYALTRFRHEAQAVGRLTHPNIAAIYDYGEDLDLAFIVIELVHGKSLFQHLQAKSRLEPKEVGDLVAQLLDGLGYAHARGVVHRDVKPSNILVTNDGRVKITDFGIARLDASQLTHVGEIMGSPGYMSPEQFLGTEIDARSDIYSVAVIAYELLAGRRPFTGNDAEVMRQVLNERAANPSEHNPAISAQLDWAVQKALTKERAQRFQRAEEFAEAFAKGIQASIRQSMSVPGPVDLTEVTTQRMDPDLLAAARMIASAREEERPAAVPDPGAKKARILFVDDEERVLSALRSIFRTQYHVFTATNGPQALAFVKRFHPNVVVSDQRMPEMTGVDLLRQVREVAPESVSMLITGYSDLSAIVGSINEGEVFRFISKPWNQQELQQAVSDAVAVSLGLADAAAVPTEVPGELSGSILVMGRDETLYRVVNEMFGKGGAVLRADDVDGMFAALESREIAVIVADIEKGASEATASFKLLKQEHPEILTVVVTDAADAELVIELINEAQIFRFIHKPVSVPLLRQHLGAALKRYAEYRQSPQLARRHRVAPPKVKDESLAEKVGGRVRSLKGWFGLAEK